MTLTEAREEAQHLAALYKEDCLIYVRRGEYLTACECAITRRQCEAEGLEYIETVEYKEDEGESDTPQ